MKTSLALLEDEELVRLGIRTALLGVPAVDLVYESASGAEFLKYLREAKPALALLDIALPGISGLEVLRQVCTDRLLTRCIMLTSNTSKPHIAEALQLGAQGFLPKSIDSGQLQEAIDQVLAGHSFVAPSLNYQPSAGLQDADLTTGELEVLKGLAQGQTYKEVADRLHLSTKTIEARRKALSTKLGLRNTADLVRYAIRNGLVNP